MTGRGEILEILKSGLHPLRLRVEERLLLRLADDFSAWRSEMAEEQSPEQNLVTFLCAGIDESYREILALRNLYGEFSLRYTGAVTEAEKKAHILSFARELGAGPRQLRGDRRAFSRWFGADAVTDRYQKRVAALERKISFCLERTGTVSARLLSAEGSEGDSVRRWRRMGLESAVKPLLAYDGDYRVRIEAFRCLAAGMKALPESVQKEGVEETTLIYAFRASMDRRQQVWIQCEALKLLESMSRESLERTLAGRLDAAALEKAADRPDDFFVRAQAVRILGRNVKRMPHLLKELCEASNDPSPYVRQALAEVLIVTPEFNARRCLYRLAVRDADITVRGAAVLKVSELLASFQNFMFLMRLMERVFLREKEPFVLRVALKTAVDGLSVLIRQESGIDAGEHPPQSRNFTEWTADDLSGEFRRSAQWYRTLTGHTERLHEKAKDLSVRRWAGQAAERMWAEFYDTPRRLKERLAARIRNLKPGKTGRLPASVFRESDEATVSRVLSVICQEDFPLDVRRVVTGGARVERGHRFRFRFWRFLYECFHPSPDKRQAFSHTTGRIFSGGIHIPSGILSELTPTKVPGEPLYMDSESGWRPYLPLVDEMISALDGFFFLPRTVRIYTSEGMIEVRASRFFLRRWWARLRLNLLFARYARLRNWEEGGQSPPSGYIGAMEKLGFRIRFQPYPPEAGKERIDPSVSRFFPAALPFLPAASGGGGLPEFDLSRFTALLTDADTWARFKAYFFSVYENTLLDLGIFAGLMAGFFFLRTCRLKYQIRKSRRRLPLVIGGWGTRGKSSVERLKGALINALGYGVLSKTTGCEAMFLHARPYDRMREMFLFRPYDKATIWEQHSLTRLADALGTDVFLWECMGLTPAYVHVLQREWMKDDLSTITNTYPDHEDIQGPAGVNIPEVMTRFIPSASTLITTEEQMFPILEQAAKERGTRVEAVNWLQAGLIPPDILERFPYEEHPYNIALVAAMAEALGIGKDFAFKSMADYVVPDIGVLKVYPPAPLKTRRIEFVSGNSANERYGALGNWRRTGFHRHNLETDPRIWITTVVNNRADRIPRSKVFAAMLAEDISADRHVLIGSNLSGLSGYIREAWEAHAAKLSLWPASDAASGRRPLEILKAQARRMRVPHCETLVKGRLKAMLAGLPGDADASLAELWADPESLRSRLEASGRGETAEEILAFLKRDVTSFSEYRELEARITGADDEIEKEERDAMDADFRDLLGKWFQRKIVVIWDFHATGNRIIRRILEETPPGLHNRVMGLQNIKGTGLDFVYSFQRWERCFTACRQLKNTDPAVFDQGLRTLSGFQEFNILCDEFVRQTVAEVIETPRAQDERIQAGLTMILSNLDTAAGRIAGEGGAEGKGGTAWPLKIIELIEAFQDAGDAVKRRKIAGRIYRDLVDERISHERAALELQALNKRQKGGWLQAKYSELVRRYRE